jgi:adenylosuccinate synthase
MVDLLNKDTLAKKVTENLRLKNLIIEKIYLHTPLNAEQIIEEYWGYSQKIRDRIIDTTALLFDAVAQNKNILFEGAQATFLDLDFGTYPYVTSSNPISGGVCTGGAVPPNEVSEIIGVLKAYTSRVGSGPFPTEQDNQIGDTIRELGHEYGTTTGRPRRCGWLDAVMIKFAYRINGLTSLAINHMDTLGKLDKIKLCIGYKLNETTSTSYPACLQTLEKVEPVYKEFDGWDITPGISTFEDLPKNAQNYINEIEKIIQIKVKYIGVGKERTDIIIK